MSMALASSNAAGAPQARRQDDTAARARCASCGAELDVPYACPACGSLVREPPGLDHFRRLGIERTYELDLAALDRRYLELSRRLHPDRRLGKEPAERTRALLLSAALNEATAALKDPVRRAEYLLVLAGGPGPDKDRRTPPGFLESTLELREELEEAKAAGDRGRLEALLASLEPRHEAALARVRDIFGRAGPALDREASAAEALRLELNSLKYVSNLVEELRASLRR